VQKISAVVPDEHARSLEARARAEDRSVSSLIRRAIAEHLDSDLKAVRQAQVRGRSPIQ
jgi:predicted transcriptional regulator